MAKKREKIDKIRQKLRGGSGLWRFSSSRNGSFWIDPGKVFDFRDGIDHCHGMRIEKNLQLSSQVSERGGLYFVNRLTDLYVREETFDGDLMLRQII